MLFGIALWCLAEALFRRSFSAVLGVDDAEPLLLAQDIQWLHHPHRPPFYYWLTWLFAQFNGYNLDTVLLVKYSTIAAALVLFYAIARRLLQRWQGAVAALLGLTFLYDTGFNPHLNLAHTLGLWLTVTLAFWLMLRAGERPSLQNFVLLGLALGLGLLSKPSFLAVVPCLLLAGLLSPR
ncbi:MAG TPA: glycosyltransferase family 39 protein, partial [Kiloniellales bacterium]|nr:glycosyltransferase family 39 protein [Kiloniellales bacterium]